MVQGHEHRTGVTLAFVVMIAGSPAGEAAAAPAANPRVATGPTAVEPRVDGEPETRGANASSTPAPASAPAPTGEESASDPDKVVTMFKDDEGRWRFRTGAHSSLRIGGTVEAYYAYNFNQPSNGITNYRAFDNRHNEFTLQTMALDVQWDSRYVTGRVALQAGHAPNTYYNAGEPYEPGTGVGAASSDAALWRALQQVYLSGHLPTKIPVDIDAGLFLSPIGTEGLATYENWAWSHTLLFFALPFYHVGARVGVAVTPEHFVRLGVYNGWNNVTDNNPEKSIAAEYTYTTDKARLGFVYFTGVERPDGAPEGRAWRHLLDAYAVLHPHERVGMTIQPTVGFEPNNFGVSSWVGGNLGLRVMATRWLFLYARGTAVREIRAQDRDGVAEPIVIPSQWQGAASFTVDIRPVEHLSFKLEYRHDHADADIFFNQRVDGDGSDEDPFVPNIDYQNTVTVGAAAYF